MGNTRKTEAMIKKLNLIYKKGYLPAREKENYSQLYTSVINCFGHACFNLSNKDLESMEPFVHQLDIFLHDFGNCGVYNYFKEAQKRIRQVGLNIEKSSLSERIENNQWKVAYYVLNDEFLGTDLHFMIQGSDGKWIGKLGSSSKIECFDKLPSSYRENYSLMGIYKITNPYVKLDKEQEMEM